MPRYRVRDGAQLPHHGEVLRGGAEVELPEPVATDPAVACLVDPVPPTRPTDDQPPTDSTYRRSIR